MRRLAGHGLTVALTLAAGVAVAIAEPVAVTGDAVKEVVIGKTIDLDTPLGMPISPEITEEQQHRVVQAIKEFTTRGGRS